MANLTCGASRRSIPSHYDSLAFATAVVSLNPQECRGGLYLQRGWHASGRRYVPFIPGDVLVHQHDMQVCPCPCQQRLAIHPLGCQPGAGVKSPLEIVSCLQSPVVHVMLLSRMPQASDASKHPSTAWRSWRGRGRRSSSGSRPTASLAATGTHHGCARRP